MNNANLITRLDAFSRQLSGRTWAERGRKGPHITREAQLLADAAQALEDASAALEAAKAAE